ncbi:MAG: divalent-cation tolerance protein CutA [Desulfovibrio sp.]|nr:divalent-cation tolerance protein CutA [Desulfovibrio sp.]
MNNDKTLNEQYQVVSTTFSDRNEAQNCAELLLAKHLVACCQISEIASVYRWQGKIEKTSEYKVEMKSKKRLFSQIKENILENHSYEVPEIIAYDITDGNEQYLQWIDDETLTTKN